MSQEYDSTSGARKRRVRGSRNRPILVTGNESEVSATTDATEVPADPEPLPEAVSETPEAPRTERRSISAIRRLPGFLSNVGKSEQDEAPRKEVDVVQARLARARRGKSLTTSSSASSSAASSKEQESPKEEAKAAPKAASTTSSKPAATRSPNSAFKMRYIIGMVIYLFGAQLLLPAEKVLMVNIHADYNLASFSLFGSPAQIDTSFILNIVTLIVLLYALVKLDFLPGSFRAMTGASSSSSGSKTSQNAGDGARRTPPPAIKPGVQGENDDLYREYRVNQRREKKR